MYLCTRPKKVKPGANCEASIVLHSLDHAHLWNLLQQHNRDINHLMYGNRRNLCDLQRARPWEPAFLRHNRDVDDMKQTCTTGTKTTLSNCNCAISMAETMGISNCAKTGMSTTVKNCNSGTAAPVVDQQRAQQLPCPRTALKARRAGPWGTVSAPQQECPDNPAPVVAQRSASTPCPRSTVEPKSA